MDRLEINVQTENRQTGDRTQKIKTRWKQARKETDYRKLRIENRYTRDML